MSFYFILLTNLVHNNLCETHPFKLPSLVVKTFAVRTVINAQALFSEAANPIGATFSKISFIFCVKMKPNIDFFPTFSVN